MRYLLERFLPVTGDRSREQPAEAALAAQDGIRLLQTIYLPDDEICMYLLESDSLERVQQASRDAHLPVDHIHTVDVVGEPASLADALTVTRPLTLKQPKAKGTKP